MNYEASIMIHRNNNKYNQIIKLLILGISEISSRAAFTKNKILFIPRGGTSDLPAPPPPPPDYEAIEYIDYNDNDYYSQEEYQEYNNSTVYADNMYPFPPPPPFLPPPLRIHPQEVIYTLQTQIANSALQIHNLTQELHTATSLYTSLQEDYIQLSNQYNSLHNANLQLTSNITTIQQLLEHKMVQMIEFNQTQSNTIQDLQQALENKQQQNDILSIQLEDLAFVIHQHETQKSPTKNIQPNNKGSLLYRLFTWTFGYTTPQDVLNQTIQSKLQKGYNLSKSTLLTALQNERQSVSDLESYISLLEHNYTLTNTLLTSKLSIIQELQSRIQVFEHDKLLLKQTLDAFKMDIETEMDNKAALENQILSLEYQIGSFEYNITSLLHQINASNLQYAHIMKEKETEILRLNETIRTLQRVITTTMEDRLTHFTNNLLQQRQEESEVLKLLTSESKQYKDQLAQLNFTIEILQRENEVLQENLTTLVQEKESIQQSAVESIQHLQELYQEAKSNHDAALIKLQTQYEQNTTNYIAQLKSNHSREREMLQGRYDILYEYYNATKNDVQDMQLELQSVLYEKECLMKENEGYKNQLKTQHVEESKQIVIEEDDTNEDGCIITLLEKLQQKKFIDDENTSIHLEQQAENKKMNYPPPPPQEEHKNEEQLYAEDDSLLHQEEITNLDNNARQEQYHGIVPPPPLQTTSNDIHIELTSPPIKEKDIQIMNNFNDYDEPVSSDDEDEITEIIMDIPDNWQEDFKDDISIVYNDNITSTCDSETNITNLQKRRIPFNATRRPVQPMRTIRKTFARYTGMHGFFSKYL